jgi:hypothetical protein
MLWNGWAWSWPQATHFTGYYCWSMWGLRQHTLLDIVVGLCGGSRAFARPEFLLIFNIS